MCSLSSSFCQCHLYILQIHLDQYEVTLLLLLTMLCPEEKHQEANQVYSCFPKFYLVSSGIIIIFADHKFNLGAFLVNQINFSYVHFGQVGYWFHLLIFF